MIDFHCHLDLYPDALRLLPEVERRNEFTLVVTTSPKAYLATGRMFSGRPTIHVALGLHPEVVEAKQAEASKLVELIPSARYVGEIGLDASPRFRPSIALQERIFADAVAECQRVGGRVMSIHSRGAAARVLDILERFPQAGTPVLHWFSGTARELQRALSLGAWFSVGPAMLAWQRGRDLSNGIPLDRMLPETDGPFAQRRGKSLMPWEAAEVATLLSTSRGLSPEALIQIFRANLVRILG